RSRRLRRHGVFLPVRLPHHDADADRTRDDGNGKPWALLSAAGASHPAAVLSGPAVCRDAGARRHPAWHARGAADPGAVASLLQLLVHLARRRRRTSGHGAVLVAGGRGALLLA